MPQPQLNDLADDILLDIFSHLGVDDILSLRKTCTRLCAATRLRHVWSNVLQSIPVLGGAALPPYLKPVTALSSSQLECVARHSISVGRRSQNGRHSSIKLDQACGVTWVHIVRGQWLLTATSDSSVSELSLWTLDFALSTTKHRPDPRKTSTAYLGGPVAAGFVDIQDEKIVIALEVRSPNPYVEILSVSLWNGSPVFTRLTRLPGVSRIRCLSGPLLGYALDDDTSIPSVIDWTTKHRVHLKDRPDVMGGCIAMTVCGALVSIVTAKHIEVYQLAAESPPSTPSCSRVCQLALPVAVVDAAVTVRAPQHESQLCSVRLCTIATNSGAEVYDIGVPLDGTAIMQSIWTSSVERYGNITRPRFGHTPESLSWYSGRCGPPWDYVSFESATIPPPSSSLLSQNISSVHVSEPNMPALHLMAVRDYDEALGILVVGNACGELSVYNVSGSYPPTLNTCFQELPLPLAEQVDLVSMERIAIHAAPPYPYSQFATHSTPDPDVRDAFLAMWELEPHLDVPEGWTSTYYDGIDDTVPWWNFVPAVGEKISYELERVKHYLGTPIPLLYSDDSDITIFRAGGLLFVHSDFPDSIWVLNHGISAADAARAFNEQRLGDHIAAKVCDAQMISTESHRYFILCEWEKYTFGRNRWKEMKERGGEVNPEWLMDEVLAPKIFLEGSQPEDSTQ